MTRALLECPVPRRNPALRLFCFPYAGGSASIFRQWPALLPFETEVWAIQLPGRGPRLSEPVLVDLDSAVHQIAGAMMPLLDRPFVCFGHSMGALLAFEVVRLLGSMGKQAAMVFVAGRNAPSAAAHSRQLHKLSDEGLIEALRRMNGTPAEVFLHPDLMQTVLPALRADFELHASYDYAPGRPLPCPLVAFAGLHDAMAPAEGMMLWSRETTSTFRLHTVGRGHFFIHTHRTDLLQLINLELEGQLCQPSFRHKESFSYGSQTA